MNPRKKKKKKGGKDNDDEEGSDEGDLKNSMKKYNNYDPDHKIYTRDELTNKIKKEELYETLQKKEELNKPEGKALKKIINDARDSIAV